jgi:hypothetical protein
MQPTRPINWTSCVLHIDIIMAHPVCVTWYLCLPLLPRTLVYRTACAYAEDPSLPLGRGLCSSLAGHVFLYWQNIFLSGESIRVSSVLRSSVAKRVALQDHILSILLPQKDGLCCYCPCSPSANPYGPQQSVAFLSAGQVKQCNLSGHEVPSQLQAFCLKAQSGMVWHPGQPDVTFH